MYKTWSNCQILGWRWWVLVQVFNERIILYTRISEDPWNKKLLLRQQDLELPLPKILKKSGFCKEKEVEMLNIPCFSRVAKDSHTFRLVPMAVHWVALWYGLCAHRPFLFNPKMGFYLQKKFLMQTRVLWCNCRFKRIFNPARSHEQGTLRTQELSRRGL